MIQLFETFLHQIVEIAILTFEFIGVGIIIYSSAGFFSVSETLSGDKTDTRERSGYGTGVQAWQRDFADGCGA